MFSPLILGVLFLLAPPAMPIEPAPPSRVTSAAADFTDRGTRRQQQQQQQDDRWAAAVDLAFASSSGNSDLTALTTALRVRHLQTRVYKLDWSIAFRYGESQGAVVARNLKSELDFDMGPSTVISPFVFATAEHDPFRKLDLRARTGSGVKYTFYNAAEGEASVRLAAQYSRDQFTGSEAPRADGGWSMEFKGAREISEAVKLENSTMFDPVFDDFGDYNFEARSKVSSRITRRLALTLLHTYSYDSTPAPDVGRTDQRIQAGLTIDF